MNSAGFSNDQLQEAERRIAWVLDHPHVSVWLKDSLRTALPCDPVVVVNDVEMLCELLRFRTDAIVDSVRGSQFRQRS